MLKNTQHAFHPSILREYDVRGIYGETLDEADAYAIGYAFSSKVQELKLQGPLIIGRDGRLSSPHLEAALIEGIQNAGQDCILIGLVPTPALYYGVKKLNGSGGIMITGSHNEGHHNGFKLNLASGPFYGQDIQALQNYVHDMNIAKPRGTVTSCSIEQTYIDRLLQDFKPLRELKVIWDAGNGATGEFLKALTQKLPGTQEIIFSEIDGNFPHHHPDPTVVENLHHLQEAVQHHKADLGIAFDGDGDRLGVVDNKGNILYGDHLMCLFARDILKDHPGAAIVFDVKCSDYLEQDISAHHGVPIRWKTGHSLIKAKIAETRALLAGELSGHIFFSDKYYGFDDALYSAVRLLNIVGGLKGPLSDFYESIPPLFQTPEIRINCSPDQKTKIMTRALSQYAGKEGVSLLDGLRVSTPQGWWLLRPSNTQDVLCVRCEATSAENLHTLKTEVNALFESEDISVFS